MTVFVCCDFALAIVRDHSRLQESDLRTVFSEAERLLAEGGEEARTAIATGFLEELSHADSRNEIDMRAIVPFLGSKSIEYIKAWDEFTGVRTRGLWD